MSWILPLGYLILLTMRMQRRFPTLSRKVDKLLVPSITITEVFKYIFRQRGEDLALECIAHMEQGRVAPLDSALAIEAAHYGMVHKLPLAESIIDATAQKFDALIWTQDCAFESLKGVMYIA